MQGLDQSWQRLPLAVATFLSCLYDGFYILAAADRDIPMHRTVPAMLHFSACFIAFIPVPGASL